MAQIESATKMEGAAATLHAEEKKGVVRLLKDNPYMGGVAIVSLIPYALSQSCLPRY